MKNNLLYLLIIFILNSQFGSHAISYEQFNFDITEIEILDKGNKFIGLKRGVISTNDGTIINADTFEYDKISNILNAKGNVKIEDTIKNYLIFADDITYLRNEEKIFTRGKTKANIESKYNIKSKNVVFLKDQQELSSNYKTVIKDKNAQVYHMDKFAYSLNNYQLKADNILIITNFGLPKSDKFYFSNAIINLDNKKFIASDTKIKPHKDIFDNSENDPKIKGVSSIGEGNLTKIKKGVFTSCKDTDNCPPWAISAEQITHDKKKKQLIYDHAVLKVYNFPILYFPKFFHPDPSVVRQSGFLKPQINDSNVVGSSITVPYYNMISDNSDFTFTTTLFDKNTKMFQNEYRKITKNANLIADFGFVKSFKSTNSKKKKNINHLFSKFNFDFDLENFRTSKLDLSIQRVSNDSFLKVFNPYFSLNSIRPNNFNLMTNDIKVTLDHENYNFITGMSTYETLSTQSSDRYQYILPYFDFNKNLSQDFLNGSLDLNSNGSNDLNNTNVFKSSVINTMTYQGADNISSLGFKTNLNASFLNLNSIGKNSIDYKSSPQSEIASIFELKSVLPLIKRGNEYFDILTPKISLRFNPGDMKNHSNADRRINANNIFNLNRLGLSDSYESGRSLTLGLEYKKENIENINKYFDFKIATLLRDKEENFIPEKSTINNKTSNIFGQITHNISENFNFSYDFAIDNDLNTFEYNDLNTSISINNFVTSFNFIKSNGKYGNTSILSNSTSYNMDDTNYFTFNTRRNRETDLTEYYDLVYEYKNDCLTAGIKYRKTYYDDRDVKPEENLLFTVTLFPLTTFEQNASDLINE
jgi:LPS-assembly protein